VASGASEATRGNALRIGGFDFDGRDATGAGGGCNGIFKCFGITPGRTRYEGMV
jgi:hypothetical protein